MSIWAVDFDNSPRHCWMHVDGKYYRDLDTLCTRDHLADNTLKLTGQVEWMRFIHTFGSHLASENNFFTSDYEGGKLVFNENAIAYDGRVCYAEEYYDRDGNLMARVFLNNIEKWARIECYYPPYFTTCAEAYAEVQASYNT